MQEILLISLLLAIIAYWWDTTTILDNTGDANDVAWGDWNNDGFLDLPVHGCATAGCDCIQATSVVAKASSGWGSDMPFIQLRIQPG